MERTSRVPHSNVKFLIQKVFRVIDMGRVVIGSEFSLTVDVADAGESQRFDHQSRVMCFTFDIMFQATIPAINLK